MSVRYFIVSNVSYTLYIPVHFEETTYGESRSVLGFTIFSKIMSQPSKNSPVQSGKFGCSNPSDSGNCPPPDNTQWKALKLYNIPLFKTALHKLVRKALRLSLIIYAKNAFCPPSLTNFWSIR